MGFQNYENYVRPQWLSNPKIKLIEAKFLDKENVAFEAKEPIRINLKWLNLQNVSNVGLRIELWNLEDIPQATYILYDFYSGNQGDVSEISLELDSSMIMDADYKMYFTFFNKSQQGVNLDLDCVPGLCFHKSTVTAEKSWIWRAKYWGYIQLPSPKIIE